MYCKVCNKYRNFGKTKISYIFKKTSSLFIVYSKCSHEYKKMFKEEQSIEILKILGLINSIEEFQKVYNHAWIKHKSRFQTEKSRWNKKLFNWKNKLK